MVNKIGFVPNKSGLDHLLSSVDGPVAKELLKLTLQVERAAKGYAPVDTGRLRASITHDVTKDAKGLVGKVGTDVTYGAAQEMGTRYQTGTPHLRPALNSLRSAR